MRVLVTAASKYGSTAEIAEAIAETLRANQNDVEVLEPADVGSLDGYDAVVLGSAVYVGHWLKPAVEFAERHASALRERPTWLFSSGPIGDPPMPKEDALNISDIEENVAPREHRLFTGNLDRGKLSFPEKAVVFALRAPTGDYRNWDNIRAWAEAIARELNPT